MIALTSNDGAMRSSHPVRAVAAGATRRAEVRHSVTNVQWHATTVCPGPRKARYNEDLHGKAIKRDYKTKRHEEKRWRHCQPVLSASVSISQLSIWNFRNTARARSLTTSSARLECVSDIGRHFGVQALQVART